MGTREVANFGIYCISACAPDNAAPDDHYLCERRREKSKC